MSKRLTQAVVFLATLAITVWWVILQVLSVKDGIYNYLFSFGTSIYVFIGGIVSLYFSVKSALPVLKKIFRYCGLALLSWGVADLIWSIAIVVYKIEVPYPSVADVFYLLFTFWMAAAFWHLYDFFQTSPKKNYIYLSMFFVLVMYVLIFFVLMRPEYSDETDLITLSFNYLYPLTDALLLSFASIMLFTVEKIKYGLKTLTFSMVFMAAGDIVFGWREGQELYWNGDISDFLYFVSAFLLIVSLIKLFYEYRDEHKQPALEA